MKKFLLASILILVSFMIIPVVNAANKTKVYMFTKNGCSACEYAFEYFDGLLEEEPDLFELVDLEVWSGSDQQGKWILGSEDLYNLMVASLEYFDEDSKQLYTPTIVVGDYIQIGVQDIKDMHDRIVELNKAEKPVDVVSDLAKKANINIDKLKKDRGQGDKETESGKYDALIIIGIFVVLIGGFAGLIIIGKK